MGKYRRILALVAADNDGAAVAQRAWQLSRFYGATLALATVVDPATPIRSNLVPLRSAEDTRRARASETRSRLEQMLAELGCDGGCEIIIGCSSEQDIVAELTCSWRPDLVLVDSRARHGMDRNSERMAYDVLTVQYRRPTFADRMINALAVTL